VDRGAERKSQIAVPPIHTTPFTSGLHYERPSDTKHTRLVRITNLRRRVRASHFTHTTCLKNRLHTDLEVRQDGQLNGSQFVPPAVY
jgi:hypothetical protein